MKILKLLRIILPPFHPLKYWWIQKRFGNQYGGAFITDDKYESALIETDEYILNELHDNF